MFLAECVMTAMVCMWHVGSQTALTSHSGIMAYGSTPYVGMTPKKNGRHIKSAQITRLKCLR